MMKNVLIRKRNLSFTPLSLFPHRAKECVSIDIFYKFKTILYNTLMELRCLFGTKRVRKEGKKFVTFLSFYYCGSQLNTNKVIDAY